VTQFQLTALLVAAIWIALVAVWFRRSTPVLAGGLVAIGAGALVTLASGAITPEDLGLGAPESWIVTIVIALAWSSAMIVVSPLADRIATRIVAAPPTLDAFRAIQQSRTKLIAGIVLAWILGAFFEELVFRGVILNSIQSLLVPWLATPLAAALAIVAAALGAGVMHLYQGARAALIITQLSVLFGVLFVVTGQNLWAVIVCHGVYDTIAFIRFANRRSRYSNLDS